jgi:hypothetical protein
MAVLSRPNLAKLSLIVKVLGYSNYIDFINSNTESFNFNDLRIDMDKVSLNTALLDRLVGCWYSYNRNLPENPTQAKEDRIWRSAMEIYKSETTGEYFIERSGGDHHKYFGKVTAYSDYVFIIMNSNTFIRQRHLSQELKTVRKSLKIRSINFTNFISSVPASASIRNRSPCLKSSGKQTEKPLFPILSAFRLTVMKFRNLF